MSSQNNSGTKVSWSDISSGGYDDSKSLSFLSLKPGNTYKIRPLGDPVIFFKVYHKNADGSNRSAIVENPKTTDIKQRHPEIKNVVKRFGAMVIDRSDGYVKIMEFSQTVGGHIASICEAINKNVGSSKEGYDIQITVKGNPGGIKREFTVVPLGQTPLSDEEMTQVKEKMQGKRIEEKLKEIFKSDTPEQIENKLFGARDSDGKFSSNATTASPSKTESKNDSYGDAFNSDESSDNTDLNEDNLW